MDARKLSRLADELDRLLELSPDERRERLEALAGKDPELADAAARALAIDEDGLPLLDGALSLDLPAEPPAPEPSASEVRSGQHIGPWRLVRELGRGGMGRVWLAVRDDGQYRFEVAIKLLEGVPDSELLREQFRRERQILADLDHPHIARLVDGGVRDNGTPWYAMEYIRGRPLDRYCREQRLGLAERLRLLVVVIRAVHHAHARLVVHRDLKPTNILVDDDGVAHLLDFGIAKMLESDDGRAGPMTLMAASTPEYAAPEQLRGKPAGTATDIHALGLIAYELITGRRPTRDDPAIDSDRGPLPSASLDGSARRRVRGDIDAIVSQALAPEPAERYASAEAMADDIERHLAGQPVLARHAGAGYRAGKFIRRHWLGVGMSSAAVVALCVALGISIVQTERARSALARASAVQEFLLGVFDAVEPAPGDAGVITQRTVADRAAQRLEDSLVGQPEARIELMIAVGRVYRKLGFSRRSEALLQGALDALEVIGAPRRDARRIEALLALGRANYQHSDFEDAVDQLARAEGLARQAGTPPGRHAMILFELGAGYSRLRRIEEALAALEEAERRARESSEARDVIPRARLLSAITLRRAGRLEAAMESGREAIALAREVLGDDHVRTAGALSSVGAMHRRAGRLDKAEIMLREAMQIELEAYGQPQSATVNNLASVLRDQGRLEESGRLFEQALERAAARYGPDTANTASYRRNLAVQQLDAALQHELV
ncbi:MAG: protein kinase domain-containing protein, partial [Wenzhouxiangella sp.]